MKTYQTCGNFNTTMGIATVKTMLPTLKHGGTYAYDSDFYNLSVTDGGRTYYVILGVLKVGTETTGDLCNYRTDKIELKSVTNCSFAYANVSDKLNTNISLTSLTNNDSIYVLCLHDNSFDLDNGGLAKLSTIRNSILTNIGSGNYKAMLEPEHGDGGDLGVTGCAF